MGRKLEESAYKRHYTLTLNPDLVDFIRKQRGVDNLSAFVNEKLRQEKMGSTTVHNELFKCPACEFTASPDVWLSKEFKCVGCGKHYENGDTLERVSRFEISDHTKERC